MASHRSTWISAFWSAVLIVLSVQGVVGYFGYELIHRLRAVLTLVLFTTSSHP
jgi:nucleobase:cation symporter-1, NCS1 family